jgi:ferric-dicitrate binding protein FerR (iron transport regulator)
MKDFDDIDRPAGIPDDAAKALAALRASPRPRASAEGRARARAAFAAPGVGAAAARARAPRARLAGYALAAVVVLGLVGGWIWGQQPRYRWRITDVVAPAGITAATADLRAGVVLAGGVIRTGPGSEIELQLGEEFRFRLLADSELVLPAPPRRWFADEVTVTVRSGHMYGTTRAALDLPLRVIGREAAALVHGTTFAVLMEPDFTCVCLWEGTVEVMSQVPSAVAPFALPAASKVMVYPDGSVSEFLPLEPPEQMKLEMIQAGGILPGASAP